MKTSPTAALLAPTSYLVAPSLHLVVQPVAVDAPAVAERKPVNWIMVADVSGSMAPHLPDVIKHFERELPRILGPKDTATLTWFSGRGQEGEVFTGEFVAGPAILEDLKRQMRRWLVPVGLTAFVEPLKRVASLAAELEKKNPGATTAMIFTTDGGDNCWSQLEILRAVDEVTKAGVRAIWMERGYWCNRGLMAAMSERSGGPLVFADSTKSYETLIEEQLGKTISGAPTRKVAVAADAVGGFAYGFNGADIVPFLVENDLGKTGAHVSVPADMREVFYLSPTQAQPDRLARLSQFAEDAAAGRPISSASPAIRGAFAGVALFGQRMNPDVTLPLLRALGDVSLIKLYQGCFTLQSYQVLVAAATEAALNPAARFIRGYDAKAVPADDCPTIFDLLDILAEGSATVRIEEFIASYPKIGRTAVDASTVVTDADRVDIGKSAPGLAPLAVFDDTVESVVAYQASVADYAERTKAHLAAVEALLATKRPLKFTRNPCPNGLPFSGLVFNGTRANLSFKFVFPGTVDFEGREREAGEARPGFAYVPHVFPTFITRAYALVADGVVNVKTLPVLVDDATFDKLRAAGFAKSSTRSAGSERPWSVDIDLSTVPVVNRKMIDSLLAADIFQRELTMYRAKCEAAVLRNYMDTAFPKQKAPGLTAKYGQDAAAWLASVGAHDYGWGPKKKDAPATDFYIANIADIGLDGLSAVPSVAKTRERLTPYDRAMANYNADNEKGAKGAKPPKALPANMTVMAPFLRELDAIIDATATITDTAERDAAIKLEVEGRLAVVEKTVLDLTRASAHAAFSLVLGRSWPSDLGDPMNQTMPVEIVDAARGVTVSTIGTLKLIEDKIDL